MQNRTVCTQDKYLVAVRLAGGPTREAQIPAHRRVTLEEECVLIENSTDNLNRRRSRWNHKPVPIFQNHFRQTANAIAEGSKVQHDPPRRPRLTQARHQALIRRHHRTLRAVLSAALAGLTFHTRDRSPRNEMFKMIGILVQPLLLEFLSALARELGAIKIGLRRQSARALHERLQGLPRRNAVNAGFDNFSFQAHVLGSAIDRQLKILARENRDGVARLESEIL